MSEILWAVPANLSAPSYWDNHSLGDNCPGNQKPVADSRDLLNRFSYNSAFMRRFFDASAADIMEFQARKAFVPLSEFKNGTTFDARQFGTGTVIKSTSETYTRFGAKDPYYYASGLLGVVCEAVVNNENLRAIAYYSQGEGDILFGMSVGDPVVEIGRVTHDRSGHYFLGQTETISRVTKIEVLHAGLGQTKQSPERSPRNARFRFGFNQT